MADVVGLYHSILNEFRLNVIKEALDNRERKSIPTEDILKLLEFLLKNNYFEFNRKLKQQLLGTAIGTTCAPPYTFKVQKGFLESQNHKPMVWFHYIEDMFFVWTR